MIRILIWRIRHSTYILVSKHLSEFYLGFILGKKSLTDSGTVAGPVQGLTCCSSPPTDFMMIHVKEKHIWSFINPPWMRASFREIPIHKRIPLPGDLTEQPFHGTCSIFSILHPPWTFLKLQWHVFLKLRIKQWELELMFCERRCDSGGCRFNSFRNLDDRCDQLTTVINKTHLIYKECSKINKINGWSSWHLNRKERALKVQAVIYEIYLK